MTDFETVPVGTMQRLRELEAHVERLNSAIIDWNARGVIPDDIDFLIDASPATSLARLKAEWQADALHELLMHPREATLRKRACELRDQLRRQAKDNTE